MLCVRAHCGAGVAVAIFVSCFVICSSTSVEAPCALKAVSGILWQVRQALLWASGSPATRPYIQLNLPLPLLVWQALQFSIAPCALASGPRIRRCVPLERNKPQPRQTTVTRARSTARRSRREPGLSALGGRSDLIRRGRHI